MSSWRPGRHVSPYWSDPREEEPRVARVTERMRRHLGRLRAPPVVVVAKSHNDNIMLYLPSQRADGVTDLRPVWLNLQDEQDAEARGAPPPTNLFSELSAIERAGFGASVKRVRKADGHVADVVHLRVGNLRHPVHLVPTPHGPVLTTIIHGQPARLDLLYVQMRAGSVSFPSVESLSLHGTALAAPHGELREVVPVSEDTATDTFMTLLTGTSA